MRKLILCLMFLVCASCAMNHGKPIANIRYLGVERYLDRNIYQVKFSSDVDVVRLFKSRISQTLICSVGDDLDFSVSHQMSQYGEGFIEPVESANGLAFKADLMFFEKKDSTSESVIEGQKLVELLAGRSSLTCKVRINSYSYKVYLSEDMSLPVADLLREVRKY